MVSAASSRCGRRLLPRSRPHDHPAVQICHRTVKQAAAAVNWMVGQGWQPFDFQREVWAAMAAGDSGLLHATTGSGKTLAVWLGAVQRARPGPGLQVLWITPMRALAADTLRALQWPLPALAPSWAVGARTGDTASAERARQDRRLPAAVDPVEGWIATVP